MNMNYKLTNASLSDSLLVNSKAVLMEARLQRLSSVSSGYRNQNAAYNLSSRANNTKPKNISNKSINVHDARSREQPLVNRHAGAQEDNPQANLSFRQKQLLMLMVFCESSSMSRAISRKI